MLISLYFFLLTRAYFIQMCFHVFHFLKITQNVIMIKWNVNGYR